MYLAFYHLKKQPFHITPDPEFLFLSPSHKEALAAIIYGIEQRKGFVGIIGAVGVGKTTILRSYLESAEKKRLKLIYVFNANLTFEELLKTVYQELGLRIEAVSVTEMVGRLHVFLIEEYGQGNTVVLVIDEAQNMPVETLESLRMISNLETSKSKLIQIVLVGQLEFEETLNLDRLRQLKQRLAIRSRVLALTSQESVEYVKFRLQKAGSNLGSVFTPAALKTIVGRAHGIPRVLNVLCDNALITGFGYQQRPVTKKIVREIIRDFEGRRRLVLDRWWLPTTVALAGLLILTAWFLLGDGAGLKKGPLQTLRAQTESGVTIKEARPGEQRTARSEEQQPSRPKREETPKPLRKADLAVTKTVIRGDTLSKLAEEVYGNSEDRVMKVIQESNPQIANPDLIHVGSTVVFPNLPGKGTE